MGRAAYVREAGSRQSLVCGISDPPLLCKHLAVGMIDDECALFYNLCLYEQGANNRVPM
jgi:hypothetical protein